MERKWWTLAGTCAGLFLLMLDSTVVALALPSIRHDVGASSQGLQWVLNGYLLAITVFVVTAGRLGDMFGRNRPAAACCSGSAPRRCCRSRWRSSCRHSHHLDVRPRRRPPGGTIRGTGTRTSEALLAPV
jgi:hypothetical protein